MLGGPQVFVILRGRNIAGAEIVILCSGLRIDQSHADQLLRMREREATQDEGIDDGELGRHSADAER